MRPDPEIIARAAREADMSDFHMKHTARLMDIGLGLGRAAARSEQEPVMDIRTPDLTREEAKAIAESRLRTLLADEVDGLPGNGDSEAAARDLAMRLVIHAFSGSAHDDERTILTALHAIDRLHPYSADEAQFWLHKAKDVAERRMKAAEFGAQPGIYTEWCMIHQIADEELDEAREADHG